MSNASHHGSEEGESIESSAGPAGGRTPRKKKTRTRDGCLTCRKCKKACDKTKPVCLRCQRLSYACEWPKIKPYSSIGAPRARSERQPSSEEQQHDGQLESSAGVNDLPAFNYSASSSSAASPIIRSAPSSCEGHLSGLTANAMTTLVPGTSPVELFSNIEPLSHQPTSMSNAESPPSNALDAHFWQDNSLYTFDYNFTDFSDIDSLLRLAGLAPLQNSDAASTPEAGAAGSSSTSQAPSNSQILLSKDKLRTFSKMFSPRVVALLDRMIAEQEGSEIQLPLAYIVSICLWAPSSAMRELLQAAKDAYSGPGMHSMLQDLGEVASSILVNKPAKATKIAIEPTEIAAMDISLSSKLFALMDIAFRQVCLDLFTSASLLQDAETSYCRLSLKVLGRTTKSSGSWRRRCFKNTSQVTFSTWQRSARLSKSPSTISPMWTSVDQYSLACPQLLLITTLLCQGRNR